GSGNITINDDLNFVDANTTLINNNTATISILADLLFNNDNSELINNGNITITDDVILGFGDDDNLITNNSAGVLNVGDRINSGSSRFVVSACKKSFN
ncbi:MAG: hypothetical protein HOC71_06610, partial [Candidatus Latescibacteria bacterium]|nr:hypothetical protein [Candidatus Latescibacterota bacterium]